MHAHLADLRAEVQRRGDAVPPQWFERLAQDWRAAELEPVERALCAYAVKLTLSPATMTALDLDALRNAGLADEAIHEAVQVVAYFNYINRVADAVHVDLEPDMPPYPAPETNAPRHPRG
jgi:uncharacterized peroxidase-related enzyme